MSHVEEFVGGDSAWSLSKHVEALAKGKRSTTATHYWLALKILADPQGHIDALVEAGVLEAWAPKNGVQPYAVVAPHVHEWQVTNAMPGDALGRCEIACATCPPNVLTNCVVPNRLPIEVPS